MPRHERGGPHAANVTRRGAIADSVAHFFSTVRRTNRQVFQWRLTLLRVCVWSRFALHFNFFTLAENHTLHESTSSTASIAELRVALMLDGATSAPELDTRCPTFLATSLLLPLLLLPLPDEESIGMPAE